MTVSTMEWLGNNGCDPLQKLCTMSYLTERDLVGPLIFHFASSIAAWQKEGELPGVTVVMLRDAQPFYVALQALGADVKPKYLRRAMFAIDDELTPQDEAKIGASHNGKLAVWLKDILLPTHVTLVDSGCWGTVVYDVAILISFISWLAQKGIAKQLLTAPSSLRPHMLHEVVMIPKDLAKMLDTGLHAQEVNTRWGIIHTIIQDDAYLAEISAASGTPLTTTALDHYSHGWRDPRFIGWNHQEIYSHIDAVAGSAMPEWFGEVINDTIEETGASKIYKGPTILQVLSDGTVGEVLEKNEREKHLIALAATRGALDAVALAQLRRTLGLPDIHPTTTVSHMFNLMQKGKYNGVWTGVLPEQTPTWSEGHRFLSRIWPALRGNPYATYVPFDPTKGVGGV